MAYFDEVIFDPIVQMIEDSHAPVSVRENAQDSAVASALKSGRIWYADGEFIGQFNASIARELREMGATLNMTRGTFTIDPTKLSMDIRGAAEQSLDRSRKLHQDLQDRLAQVQAHAQLASTGVDVGDTTTTIVKDLAEQFNGTIAGIDVIEVSAKVTQEMAVNLNRELTENLDLSIKNFVQSEIPKLRAEVEANAFAGFRADRLAEIIQQKYGVTKRKAAFLAEQETSLLVSKYREQRYRAMGSRRYVWSTSHDERVRPDHKVLNGTTQSFDLPPVTNRKTGARNNPGEDFRCRCVAMPVIEIPE